MTRLLWESISTPKPSLEISDVFPGGAVLPVISNQKINDYLKELAELAGLNAPVTQIYYQNGERIEETQPKYAVLGTHAGRRTFICNALSMGIPADIVMKWTGHSDYTAMKPTSTLPSPKRARQWPSSTRRDKLYFYA